MVDTVKQFLISLPSKSTQKHLNDLLLILFIHGTRPEPAPGLHFTLLYLPNPVTVTDRLLGKIEKVIPEIDKITVRIKSLKLISNYLMIFFEKDHILNDLHEYLLSCLGNRFYCDNHQYLDWSPHMVLSVLEPSPENDSKTIDLSSRLTSDLKENPLQFDKVLFTRLIYDNFETVGNWVLQKA